MQVDQIKQREQIDPDNIDKVPVQSAHFHGGVVFRSEASPPSGKQEPSEEADADDHMQRVQSGHDEVKREINLRVTPVSHLVGMSGNWHVVELEARARDVMLLELLGIFRGFDAEEGEAENDGEHEAADEHGALALLCGVDGKDDGQATADQHGGVGGAEFPAERLAGGGEVAEVRETVNQVGAEQTSEEHDFGAEEDPHAETGGVFLLLRFGEVVQQLRMMLLFVMEANDGAIRQL